MANKKIDYDAVLKLISPFTDVKLPPTSKSFNWQTVVVPPSPNQQPYIRMKVINKRSFQFEETHGFIWYKNLNIPQVKMISNEMYQLKCPPFNLKSKIVSICKNLQDDQISVVDLQGKTDQTVKWGECEFNGLRFSNTSHINKGCYYFLVIVLYQEQEQNNTSEIKVEKQNSQQQSPSTITQVLVSPALYIHSRKKAHKERQTKDSFYEPFNPDALEKQLFTEDEKVQENDNNKINKDNNNAADNNNNKSNDNNSNNNNMTRLVMYLSNKRIRHKVYHPIFLLFKFTEAIKLYYNINIVKINQNDTNFLTTLQHEIQNQFEVAQNQQLKLKDKIFLMCLNSQPSQQKDINVEKVSQLLKCLDGPILTLTSMIPASIHKNFKEIVCTPQLVQLYNSDYKTCKLFYSKGEQKPQQNIEKQLWNDMSSDGKMSIISKDKFENPTLHQMNHNKYPIIPANKIHFEILDSVKQKNFHTAVFNLSITDPQEKSRRIPVKAVRLQINL